MNEGRQGLMGCSGVVPQPPQRDGAQACGNRLLTARFSILPLSLQSAEVFGRVLRAARAAQPFSAREPRATPDSLRPMSCVAASRASSGLVAAPLLVSGAAAAVAAQPVPVGFPASRAHLWDRTASSAVAVVDLQVRRELRPALDVCICCSARRPHPLASSASSASSCLPRAEHAAACAAGAVCLAAAAAAAKWCSRLQHAAGALAAGQQHRPQRPGGGADGRCPAAGFCSSARAAPRSRARDHAAAAAAASGQLTGGGSFDTLAASRAGQPDGGAHRLPGRWQRRPGAGGGSCHARPDPRLQAAAGQATGALAAGQAPAGRPARPGPAAARRRLAHPGPRAQPGAAACQRPRQL